MKIKTINAVICKKFDELLKSITDSEVRIAMKKGTIITGGCIASMLLRETVNDFDLYFKDKQTAFKIASYFVDKFNVLNPSLSAKVQIVDELGKEAVSGDRVRVFIKSAGVAGEVPQEQIEVHEMEKMDDVPVEVVGVDAAYFNQIIYDLKAKDSAQVDSGYLMTIIDRIF